MPSTDYPAIRSIGTANPAHRFTQEEIFQLIGYASERVRTIFLNSDIDYRHVFLDGEPNRFESSDQLNQRFLKGAVHTGCRAIQDCLARGGMEPSDVDLLVACTSTGYVCPDVGSRLVAHMGFRRDIQRTSIVGLGCAGAIPTMQRAWDFVRARPGSVALVLTVEICSACFYVDHSMDTVIGNAICADGAAAALITSSRSQGQKQPEMVDFQSFVDPEQLDQVGFDHEEGKLRIVLSSKIRNLAPPLLQNALAALLKRHSLEKSDIRFWIAHPGGRKVIDNVQEHLGLSNEDVQLSRHVLRNYGNMSSPTVLFVLNEVMQRDLPRPGDWGVMLALGPGMAAEVCLLKW
jgi:predicted naringenin-chalcone synthase